MAAGRSRSPPSSSGSRKPVAAFERAGYEHRGEQGLPGREFFRRGHPRAYHLHLVDESGDHWRNYLAFRNYLREHPNALRRVAEAKRALAARFPCDRQAYTEGKTPVVQDILRLASGLV